MNLLAAVGAMCVVLGVVNGARSLTVVTPRRAVDRTAQSSKTPKPPRPALAVIGLVSVAFLAGPFPAVVALVGALGWPHARAALDERRQRQAIDVAVPDAIELLVLVVRAGLTPHQAVTAMVDQAPEPIRAGFAAVVARTERGHVLADALQALPESLGPSLVTVADTLAISERHGSPIGDALTQLSIEVRQRRRQLAEADARKLPVRLSFPLVCCTLPSFVLVAIAPAVLAALSSLGDTTW